MQKSILDKSGRANALSHTQNTDSKLDDGGVNEVASSDLRTHLDSTSNPHSVIASQVEALEVGTATYDDLQDYINVSTSAGRISGGTLGEVDATHISVTAGTGMIKITNSAVGVTKFIDWTTNNNLEITTSATNYIYVNYNTGTGAVTIEATTDHDTINKNTMFVLGAAYGDGVETAHVVTTGMNISNWTTDEHTRLVEIRRIERASGGVISETGVRNISSTAGVFYIAGTRQTTSAKDSAIDKMTYVYKLNGVWTFVEDQTVIDNTQYNDVSTPGAESLAELGNAKFGVHWIYILYDGSLYSLYGYDSYNLAEAEAAQPPGSIPTELTDFGILAAKIIILKNAVVFTQVDSAYTTIFTPISVANHNDLGGLNDGDDYEHLTAAQKTIITRAATAEQDGYATSVQITKLDGIEAGAEVNNISDVNATDLTDGGDTTLHDHDGITENTAARHTQGTDTALGVVGTKNPPIDADKLLYRDSTSSDALVTSTWTQVKSFLKTYLDTLYNMYVHPNHSGDVTSVADGAQTIANKQTLSATAPITVSNTPTVIAGDAPVIAIPAATDSQNGYATSTQITKLDGIEASAVALTTVKADTDIADAISNKHAKAINDASAWFLSGGNSGGGIYTSTYNSEYEERIISASTTLSGNLLKWTLINNYGQTDDMTLSLAEATANKHFVVLLGTTVAKYLHIDPYATDVIYFNGVALTAGYWAGIASALAGACISFTSFKTGASTWSWYVSPISGNWVYET